MAKRGGEQGATDAIADRVETFLAGGLKRGLDGGIDALFHIVVPGVVTRDFIC